MTEIDRQLHKIVIDTIPEKLKLNGLIPCRRCGWCCRNNNAFLLNSELENICRYTNIDKNVFKEKYVIKNRRNDPNEIRIMMPCPFLDDTNNCSIYPIRPLSCALYPFAATLLIIKPCQKGLEMYKILEKWYESRKDSPVKVNDESIGDVMAGFYSRQFPNIDCIDDTEKPMEIEDILKNDEIKSHGLTVIPDKKGLKRLCRYIKKRDIENVIY